MWCTLGWSTAVGNTWTNGKVVNLQGIYRADNLARSGTTIELSNEFLSIEIPLITCKLMIDLVIVDSSNCRWTASDKGIVALMIWQRLNRRCSSRLLKLQKDKFGAVNGVVTGHCMDAPAWRNGVGRLANYFYRSCRYKKEKDTVLHLLGTFPALCQRRKAHLVAYHIHDLGNLSNIDVDCLSITMGASLSAFIQFIYLLLPMT